MADEGQLKDLETVRDWLRYAVSRFGAEKLSYGHGTSRAIDDAAFLILETLKLPIEDINPWLDARLLLRERQALLEIIEARISTRKPSAYLTGAGYIRGHRFRVDERVIVPRSFIGEMLCDVIDGTWVDGDGGPFDGDPADVVKVLDLCTGGGSLAILAALAFPSAEIDAVDVSQDALDVADLNVRDYGLDERIHTHNSDLFSTLGKARYNLILSNPPYVTEAAVAAFPPEHRAEPRLAHLAGTDGMDVARRILAKAHEHLEPDGWLVMEIGQGRQALTDAFPHLPFEWLDTAESEAEVLAIPAVALGAPATGRRRR